MVHIIVSILLGWFTLTTTTDYSVFDTNTNGTQIESTQDIKGNEPSQPNRNSDSKDGDVL